MKQQLNEKSCLNCKVIIYFFPINSIFKNFEIELKELIFEQKEKNQKFEGIKEQIVSYSKRITMLIQFTIELIGSIVDSKFNTIDFITTKKSKTDFFNFLKSLSSKTPNLESKDEVFTNFFNVRICYHGYLLIIFIRFLKMIGRHIFNDLINFIENIR